MRCCPTPSAAPPTTRWGKGRRQGEAFTPPPDWDAGFEFSGRGCRAAWRRATSATSSPNCSAARARGARAARGGRAASRCAARTTTPRSCSTSRTPGAAPRGRSRCAAPQVDAQGRVSLQPRTLDVKIPAGVKPGQLIRLAGQGGAGHGGAPAGDLFLEVHFKPHPRFRD